MSRDRPLGAGVIGFGFMGRIHAAAWQRASADGLPCRLVAIADPNEDRRRGREGAAGNLAAAAAARLDLGQVKAYEDARDLLDDPGVEAVSICTRTGAHVALALAALEAGRHVLVEKPVALETADVARLAARAAARPLRCMPAHCMRFWPGWELLLEHARRGDLGRVRSAIFQRLGSPPAWSPAFYGDPSESGGALADLHVHDADFVRALFGDPADVLSTGGLLQVTTLYRYPDGPPHVVATGGWEQAAGFGFRMRYTVAFDAATLDFDLARDPPLLACRGSRAEPVPLETLSAYDREVRHFLAAVRDPDLRLAVTLEDALGVARLLDAERESLRTGLPAAVARAP